MKAQTMTPSKPKPTSTPKEKSEKKASRRRALGVCFMGPALLMVLAMAHPKLRVYMVDDTTPKEKVQEYTLQNLQGSKKEKLFIVVGINNLSKLGPKSRPRNHVVVCDVPDLLHELRRFVRIADAVRDEEGHWRQKKMDQKGVEKRLLWSSYAYPVSPEKIAEVRSSFVVELPSPAKKFDPIKTLDSILDKVSETHREQVQLGIFSFLSGLIGRRAFSGIRRKIFNRVRGGEDTEKFKTAFSTLQRWIESDIEGRKVTAAYQMCSRKGIAAPVSAARADAHLEMLMRLIRVIPPSSSQKFEGWKYRARTV